MANVEWSYIDRATPAPFMRGDYVSSEAGALPLYEVMAVDGERLWLRDALTARDCVLPTDTMRWRVKRP